MDLTEAEDIKKRWQEYTEELYKKDLNDPDNHNSMMTHLETDILEWEIKWALGSITTNKANGDDGIPTELFQTWKLTLPWGGGEGDNGGTAENSCHLYLTALYSIMAVFPSPLVAQNASLHFNKLRVAKKNYDLRILEQARSQ